jgi:hypothetical protein
MIDAEAEEIEIATATKKPEPEPEPTTKKPGSEPEPEPEPEAEHAKNALFLMGASFGPTKETLAEKSKMLYAPWIQKQMGLPPTSHREYFRSRTNPDLPAPELPARDTCSQGSRWTNAVFNFHDAVTKAKVTVSGGKILVNGQIRSSINPSAVVQKCTDTVPPNKRWLDGKTCKDHKDTWRHCYHWEWRKK